MLIEKKVQFVRIGLHCFLLTIKQGCRRDCMIDVNKKILFRNRFKVKFLTVINIVELETNVSVYLKRGIFDDEFGEGAPAFRRSGDNPIAEEDSGDKGPGEISDAGEKASPGGRRFDKSIYESDDNNKFEGSLLKLTKGIVSTTEPTDSESEDIFRRSNRFKDPSKLDDVKPNAHYSVHLPEVMKLPADTSDTLLNQMKNLQSELNAARANQGLPNQQSYNDKININKKPNPYAKNKLSGRRDYMSDYGAIDNIPLPYSSRRSGAAPVLPLNVFSKQELDNEADKYITPKPVVTEGIVPKRSTLASDLEINAAPTRVFHRSDFSNKEYARKQYKYKSPSEDYIDDDFNKIPVRRK